MSRKKWAIVLILLMSVLALAGDRVAPGLADTFPSAKLMPQGALLYIQSRDLGSQLKTWTASETHNRYYNSANYKSFLRSRIALKFEERINEFQDTTGIGLDLDRLTTAMGGQSALALYNIGELEFVFTTEMAHGQALTSALYKQANKLEARKFSGETYYVKSTSGSNSGSDHTFCFVALGDRVVLTTSEELMRRVLRNSKEVNSTDQLLPTIVNTATQAEGFTAHDLTLWLDQEQLNKNLYFRNYWIHNNVKEFEKISTAIIDLEIGTDGLRERRWLLEPSVTGQETRGDLANVIKFAPGDTPLVRAAQVGEDSNATGDDIAQVVQHTIFGRTLKPIALPAATGNTVLRPDSPESTEAAQPAKYSYLDSKFDVDIDSEELATSLQKSKDEDAERFLTSLRESLAAAKPLSYALMSEPVLDNVSGFVNFNRAVVIELGMPNQFVAAQWEKNISQELARRFTITGSNNNFSWQSDASGSRSLAQSLIDQGGAYIQQNNMLLIGNNREYLAKILQAIPANSAAKANALKVANYAVVKLKGGKAPFDKLMRRLDGVGQIVPVAATAVSEGEGDEVAEEQATQIKLYSDNISSLIDIAQVVSSVTFQRTVTKGMAKEMVFYRY